jgi:hypothetical protein
MDQQPIRQPSSKGILHNAESREYHKRVQYHFPYHCCWLAVTPHNQHSDHAQQKGHATAQLQMPSLKVLFSPTDMQQSSHQAGLYTGTVLQL